MNRGKLLLLAVAIGIVVVGAWWMLAEPAHVPAAMPEAVGTAVAQRGDTAGPGVPPPVDDAERLAPRATSADIEGAEDTAPTLATPRARLVGRVTFAADGRPATDVLLTARLDDERTGEALTDDDGRYAIAFDAAGRLRRIDVAPAPGTPRQRILHELDLPLGEDTLFDFAIDSGATLAGVVVDAGGRPVDGARVLGWSGPRWTILQRGLRDPDQTVLTDATGAFRIADLGPSYLLAAETDELATHALVHGRVDDGTVTSGVTLVVSPRRELVGIVLGPDERPVAGARIEATSRVSGASERLTELEGVYVMDPPAREATSGDDGRFTLGSLCGRVYDVHVQHATYPDWSGTHGPGDGELVVRLEEGLTLTGTVSSSLGGGVADAEIQLGSISGGFFGEDQADRTTTTDAEGRFLFIGLAPDPEAFVAVRGAGHAIHVEQPVSVVEGGVNEVHVVLAPELRLAGIVTDPKGNPYPDARVTIEGDRLVDHGDVTMSPTPTWERRFRLSVLRTDEDGVFRVATLYDGVFRIEATHPEDDGLRAVVEARAGNEKVHLVLDPDRIVGVTLTGVARDVTTGLPVEAFDVTPMIPSGGGGLIGTSEMFEDEQGRWTIAGLDPGPMMITAFSRGYAPWSQPLAEYDEGLHTIDIGFAPTRRAVFRVHDADGAPIPDVNLQFQDELGAQLMVESGPSSRGSMLQTDAGGEAIAAGLPAATITVLAEKGWLSPKREYAVDLRTEPRGPIELLYGAPEEQAVLVIVVTGTPSKGVVETITDVPGLMAVQDELVSGSLRPLLVPARVAAIDEGGVAIVEQLLDPAGGNPDGFTLPGVTGAFATKLLVPVRPLTFRVEADGFVPIDRSWTPVDGSGSEVLVVVLQPE